MRFFKIISAVFLMFTMLTITVFYSRSSVVTSLVNDYLAQHHSAITCIDFTLNSNADLLISRLCIDSPYAEVELIDTLITWRFESSHFEVDKIADAISAINIASVNVRAKDNIKFSGDAKNTALQLNDLPRFIKQKLDDISSLSVPINLAIEAFQYQAFSKQLKQPSRFYHGKLLATKQQLTFLLDNTPLDHAVSGSLEQLEIFSFVLNKEPLGFTANISTDLAKLKTLLTLHEAMLPSGFATLFTNNKNETWSVVGKYQSEFEWQKQTLSMSNTLSDFSFQVSPDFAQSAAVKLDAALTWKTSLVDDSLQLDFVSGSNIQLDFDHLALMKSTSVQAMDQQLVDFLNDNVMDTLAIEPLGSVKVNFSEQIINSDGINFTSTNLNEGISLSLNDLVFNYREDAELVASLQQANFAVVGQVKVAQLAPWTQLPVMMNVAGDIEHHSDFWQLNIAPNTAIELAQLSLPASQITRESLRENKKSQPSLKTLLSHWQGNIAINKNNAQGKREATTGLTFDLQIDNQIKQLNLPNTLQAQTVEINTKLSGSFADIAINANVMVDNLAIASANISGDILTPYVEVMAKDVLITDLLALKVKPPIEMKLIDGTLNYHLSSQIKNTDNLMANPMYLALSIKDLTGEVDGTWLQELNWQHKFIIKNYQISPLSDGLNEESNLTIANIETAIPIINFSSQTIIAFEDDELNIKVNNTTGKLLGGRFDIAQAQWPLSKYRPFEVKLTKIDLEKLLELDKKQGIVVTGRVSGKLPINYDGENFLINDGGLHNVGAGLIQVFDNPAVEELKISNTQLKLAFDALENLHYHHLSSEVSMANDGYMLLKTVIKGRNPDLDNEVNLNLNLSYDLLGLIESLTITEHFENKLIKGLQKN